MTDLARIVEYISADKSAAAKKLAMAIRAKTENLRLSPYLGREVMPGIRELVVHHHYLVSYRVKAGRIDILQVWHAARRR